MGERKGRTQEGRKEDESNSFKILCSGVSGRLVLEVSVATAAMHTGESPEGNPPRSASGMEQGSPAPYYHHTPSPALLAVKRNLNHMNGLNLGLRIAEFILSVIAFSVMASANENGAVFSTFTTYRCSTQLALHESSHVWAGIRSIRLIVSRVLHILS